MNINPHDRAGFEATTPGGKALQVMHVMGVPVEFRHADGKAWHPRDKDSVGTKFYETNYYRTLQDEDT